MAEVLPIHAHRGGGASEVPEPPDTLSPEAADIWRSVAKEWVIGADALPILRLGMEAWDRYRQAEELLRREGPVIVNPKSGLPRAHPAHTVAKDNLAAVRMCFRQLRLEPPVPE